MPDILNASLSRVFLLENRAGPTVSPSYESTMAAGQPSANAGDVTNINIPDPDAYGKFKVVGKLIGEDDAPEIPLTARYTTDLSTLLRLKNLGCDHDVQVHLGRCENPQNFTRGWQKVLLLEAARITTYGFGGSIGALDPGDDAVVNEEVTFTGEELYEIKRLTFAEQAAATITRELVDLAICDAASCGGDCGVASDGCQKVFMISVSSGGSPGLPADVIYTENGGGTWSETNIDSLPLNRTADAVGCVGDNLIVISEDDEALHYAPIADILLGTEVWTRVATGFVATKGPQDIFVAGPNDTWIVGEGGYIYFTSDPTGGVTVQSAGSATIQDLKKIHGIDNQHVVTVGGSNAVVVTHDGGVTWASKTGPAVGVVLNTVWMVTKDIYWVGAANGNLYYTTNDGSTWTSKGFSGSGAGQVRDIVFATRSVGYLSHDTATPAGRMFRTIDGGGQWYLMPEGTGSIVANDRINALAACNQNTVFGAGLADNGTDGFSIKAS